MSVQLIPSNPSHLFKVTLRYEMLDESLNMGQMDLLTRAVVLPILVHEDSLRLTTSIDLYKHRFGQVDGIAHISSQTEELLGRDGHIFLVHFMAVRVQANVALVIAFTCVERLPKVSQNLDPTAFNVVGSKVIYTAIFFLCMGLPFVGAFALSRTSDPKLHLFIAKD